MPASDADVNDELIRLRDENAKMKKQLDDRPDSPSQSIPVNIKQKMAKLQKTLKECLYVCEE